MPIGPIGLIGPIGPMGGRKLSPRARGDEASQRGGEPHMSFKAFIYYCAICGGWAAFVAWFALWAAGVVRIDNPFLKTPLIAGFLGLLVAAGVGAVDAKLNAVGFQRVLRVVVCMAVGLVGGALGGLVGEGLHQINE